MQGQRQWIDHESLETSEYYQNTNSDLVSR